MSTECLIQASVFIVSSPGAAIRKSPAVAMLAADIAPAAAVLLLPCVKFHHCRCCCCCCCRYIPAEEDLVVGVITDRRGEVSSNGSGSSGSSSSDVFDAYPGS
jgi:hypothetical protein